MTTPRFRILYYRGKSEAPSIAEEVSVTQEKLRGFLLADDPRWEGHEPVPHSDVVGMIATRQRAMALGMLSDGQTSEYRMSNEALGAVEMALVAERDAVYGVRMTFRGVPVVHDPEVPWVDLVIREVRQ